VTVVAVSMADNDNKGEIRERLIFGKCDEGNECSTGGKKKRCGGRYTMGALVFVFLKKLILLYIFVLNYLFFCIFKLF
jgi:hypothetical protein